MASFNSTAGIIATTFDNVVALISKVMKMITFCRSTILMAMVTVFLYEIVVVMVVDLCYFLMSCLIRVFVRSEATNDNEMALGVIK